jgi:protein-tyrosine-phosphatase
MHIHFVCRGNAYRSRLSESYLNSKQVPSLIVSSSGIEAHKHINTNGPISWVAQRLIQNHGLVPFMAFQPTQTTLALLQQADLIIFMEAAHLHYAQEQFGYTDKNFQVWNILDIEMNEIHQDKDKTIIEISEKTFQYITSKIDEMVETLVIN